MHDLNGTAVSIIGAARSGTAAAILLRSRGARVFVSDRGSADAMAEQLEILRVEEIPYETGGHTERVYDCSLLVISPGVPSDAPVVLEAKRRNIQVVSELEAASWFCRAPILAITGSNGKTTTTTLLAAILEAAKRPHDTGGNIGRAFSLFADALKESDTAVLEVSSFQLDHCAEFRPHVAALLNITADHMDRYDHSMDLYAASKARIFMNQGPNDILIYGADDPWTLKVLPAAKSRTIAFGLQPHGDECAFLEEGRVIVRLGGARIDLIGAGEIFIKGTHNLYNAMAASLMALVHGVDVEAIRATLRTFPGVEHRLEFVRELDGVRYYNDSKATNVDSVWYALQAFTEPIVLLLGGRDKGNDYTRLEELVRAHVRAIVAIGESAGTVREAFQKIVPVTTAGSIDEAVAVSRSLAHRGDAVLLSPACASFDWFKNYEQRGRVFKQLVQNLD